MLKNDAFLKPPKWLLNSQNDSKMVPDGPKKKSLRKNLGKKWIKLDCNEMKWELMSWCVMPWLKKRPLFVINHHPWPMVMSANTKSDELAGKKRPPPLVCMSTQLFCICWIKNGLFKGLENVKKLDVAMQGTNIVQWSSEKMRHSFFTLWVGRSVTGKKSLQPPISIEEHS